MKASVNCIQLWEKAPLEPYASPKPVSSCFTICSEVQLTTWLLLTNNVKIHLLFWFLSGYLLCHLPRYRTTNYCLCRLLPAVRNWQVLLSEFLILIAILYLFAAANNLLLYFNSFLFIVYEICKLGTHSPQMGGGQKEISSFKSSPSGLFLVEAPQQVKNVRCHLTSVSLISDLFLSLSKGWSVKSFISSVTKVIKDFKLTSNSSLNQKESNGSPCTVRVFLPLLCKILSYFFFETF